MLQSFVHIHVYSLTNNITFGGKALVAVVLYSSCDDDDVIVFVVTEGICVLAC